jgi:hypothetical protein
MASRAHFHKVARRRTSVFLLGARLLTSAVHFVDNAFRLDLYPGPAWLTRNDVLLAWLALLALAWLVYCGATRVGLVTYGLLGFVGLAHYLVPHHQVMPLRCAVTIFGEAIASAALIVYVLSRDSFAPPHRLFDHR